MQAPSTMRKRGKQAMSGQFERELESIRRKTEEVGRQRAAQSGAGNSTESTEHELREQLRAKDDIIRELRRELEHHNQILEDNHRTAQELEYRLFQLNQQDQDVEAYRCTVISQTAALARAHNSLRRQKTNLRNAHRTLRDKDEHARILITNLDAARSTLSIVQTRIENLESIDTIREHIERHLSRQEDYLVDIESLAQGTNNSMLAMVGQRSALIKRFQSTLAPQSSPIFYPQMEAQSTGGTDNGFMVQPDTGTTVALRSEPVLASQTLAEEMAQYMDSLDLSSQSAEVDSAASSDGLDGQNYGDMPTLSEAAAPEDAEDAEMVVQVGVLRSLSVPEQYA